METIHVGIGHKDDLLVADLADIVVLFPDSRSQGRDDDLDLLVLQHLVETGLFHVEDLAAKGENGLIPSVPTLLGRTPGGVSLHEIQLTPGRIPFLAIGQFSRQGTHLEGALTAGQLPGPTGRLPGPGRFHALV